MKSFICVKCVSVFCLFLFSGKCHGVISDFSSLVGTRKYTTEIKRMIIIIIVVVMVVIIVIIIIEDDDDGRQLQ